MTASDTDQKMRRRKILKAAAGAPVVFTLSTGAALAAGSLGCDVKSANRAATETPPVPGVLTSDTSTPSLDDWMRFSLEGYELNRAGGPKVDGFLLGGKAYQVNTDGTVTELLDYNGNSKLNGKTYTAIVDYSSYAAGDAESMYVYHGVAVANPIAGASCWNSLNATSLISNIIN